MTIMADPVSDEFYNTMATLYSRKLSKKSFTELACDFKKRTGGADLCKLIDTAQRQLVQDMVEIKTENLGQSLRTMLYKGIDYTTYKKYCPVRCPVTPGRRKK